MAENVSFDRVADSYDATRALPEEVSRTLTDAIVAELARANSGRLLEAGIGTGRISRPLCARGVRVVGVDVAPLMLARLLGQLDAGHRPPDLALGDLTRLPFTDGSFGAVLLVNVLHLVSSLEAAVAEVRRVLAPGGALVRGTSGSAGASPWAADGAKWNEMMAERRFTHRTRQQGRRVQGALRGAGGSVRVEAVAEYDEVTTPAGHIGRIRDRTDSWSWALPDALFAECFAEYEQWAQRHYEDMHRPLTHRTSYALEAWTFR